MKTNKKKIPKIKSEDEERAFWSEESPLDYLDKDKAKKVILSKLELSPLIRTDYAAHLASYSAGQQ